MPTAQPNILFLMTDQLRLDHTGLAGEGARVATPNIDRIAAGTAFTRCVTVNPICTPARAALLTGKYSHQVGLLDMSGDLSLQHPTYPRALQRAGYRTYGIGKFHFLQTWRWGTGRGEGVDLVALREKSKRYGFDKVWEAAGKQLAVRNYCDYCAHLDERGLLEHYRDFVESCGPNTSSLAEIRNEARNGDPSPLPDELHVDAVIADQIIDAIRGRPDDRPFFIFGSFLSPHKPYDPPQSYIDAEPETYHEPVGLAEPVDPEIQRLLAKQQRSYRALVRFTDDQIGRVLDTLEAEGLANDTVVLFTSDHGEMLGDHGRVQKRTYYTGSAVVPTAIRDPRHDGGVVCDSPVEITDLTATILECAGLDVAASLSKPWPRFHDRVPCRSLMPIVRGEATAVREVAFSECGGEWEAIVGPRYTYVKHAAQSVDTRGSEELYDLEVDPDQTRNLLASPGSDLHESASAFLTAARDRLAAIREATPPAQTRWAPLPPGGEAFSYG